ncbi:MAG: response regulator, partial [Anaerolineae bacterium]|nr:response regulator [Anaerolineae bacterium]
SFTLPLGIPYSDVHEHNVRESALRWFNPYQPYEARTRPFKASSPIIVPRYVVLEKGETLRRLLLRYMDDVEVESVQDAKEALAVLHRSPAQALVVNVPQIGDLALLREKLSDVPYSTPIITCWVPGEVQFEQTLGVIRYLIKPVTRDDLLKTLESLNNSPQPTPRQILIVDDERDLVRLFIRMLSSAGDAYQVLWATNGTQALRLMRERQPDIILLDLVMPEMDGFQVLQEKSRDPTIQHIPVVVVTSLDPQGEPIMSDLLTVSRGTGLSARDLLACIELLSKTLTPSVHPVPPGNPGA